MNKYTKKAIAALGIAAFLVCYIWWLYYHFCDLEPSADMTSHLMQANAVLQGNTFLKHWWNANFAPIVTDLPYYILMLVVNGISVQSMWMAYSLAYAAAVMLAAMLLCQGMPNKRWLALLVLAATVILPCKTLLNNSSVHFGVPSYLMLALLLTVCLYKISMKWKPLLWLLLVTVAACGSVCDRILLLVLVCPLAAWGILEAVRNRKITKNSMIFVSAAIVSAGAFAALKFWWENNCVIVITQNSVQLSPTFNPVKLLENTGRLLVLQANMLGISESPFSVIRILFAVAGAVIALITLLQMLRGKENDFVQEIAATAYWVLMAGVIVTGQVHYRYCLSGIFLLCLVLGRYLMQNAELLQKRAWKYMFVAAAVLACACGISPLQKEVEDTERMNTIKMMEEAGITRAYSTGFWYEVPLWVYSHGEVKVLTTHILDEGINSFQWFEDSREYKKPVYAILCGLEGSMGPRPDYVIERVGEPAKIYSDGKHELLVYDCDLSEFMDVHRPDVIIW